MVPVDHLVVLAVRGRAELTCRRSTRTCRRSRSPPRSYHALPISSVIVSLCSCDVTFSVASASLPFGCWPASQADGDRVGVRHVRVEISCRRCRSSCGTRSSSRTRIDEPEQLPIAFAVNRKNSVVGPFGQPCAAATPSASRPGSARRVRQTDVVHCRCSRSPGTGSCRCTSPPNDRAVLDRTRRRRCTASPCSRRSTSCRCRRRRR